MHYRACQLNTGSDRIDSAWQRSYIPHGSCRCVPPSAASLRQGEALSCRICKFPWRRDTGGWIDGSSPKLLLPLESVRSLAVAGSHGAHEALRAQPAATPTCFVPCSHAVHHHQTLWNQHTLSRLEYIFLPQKHVWTWIVFITPGK